MRAALVEQRDEINEDITALDRIIKRLRRAPQIQMEFTETDHSDQAQLDVLGQNYSGMTTADAAESFLRSAMMPCTTREISDQLLAGGFDTEAKSFYSNLYSTLRRDGRFERVNSRWKLKEQEF